jgi:hypothetical protein
MERAYRDEISFPMAQLDVILTLPSGGAAEVRVHFVLFEELLNSRCGHDVRSCHPYLEPAPHFRM